MSTAPSILRIKRKAGEEPVESLYVQNLDGSKRVRTEQSYVFHRLIEAGYDARTTTASEQTSTMQAVASNSMAEQQHKPTSTRRFHLSRPTASHTKDRRARKSLHDSANIAVLVEDRPVSIPSSAATIPAAHTSSPDSQPAFVSTQTVHKKPPGGKYGKPRPPPVRKRMQSISQEKRATFEQWAQEEMGTVVIGDSTAPQSITAPTITPGVYGVASSAGGKGQDSQTKAPATDAMDMDDEGDYVYDTYVRHMMQTDAGSTGVIDASSNTSALPLDAEAGNIGYLVISDLDIELWETYASDPDEADDKDDWDSEQDDENAENYYGADYPEEEVSSDDEHSTNAYRYRSKRGGLSDEEEYDLAEDSSEQDELEELEPWRRQQAARTGVYRLGVGEVTRQGRRLDADDDNDHDAEDGS